MKKELVLENYGVMEMEKNEKMELEGGILPAIAYGICWGVMTCCSAIAAGMALEHKPFKAIK